MSSQGPLWNRVQTLLLSSVSTRKPWLKISNVSVGPVVPGFSSRGFRLSGPHTAQRLHVNPAPLNSPDVVTPNRPFHLPTQNIRDDLGKSDFSRPSDLSEKDPWSYHSKSTLCRDTTGVRQTSHSPLVSPPPSNNVSGSTLRTSRTCHGSPPRPESHRPPPTDRPRSSNTKQVPYHQRRNFTPYCEQIILQKGWRRRKNLYPRPRP